MVLKNNEKNQLNLEKDKLGCVGNNAGKERFIESKDTIRYRYILINIALKKFWT